MVYPKKKRHAQQKHLGGVESPNKKEIWDRPVERKIITAFEKDKFNRFKANEPMEWLLRQQRRMESAYPEITNKDRRARILMLMPGDLSHAMKSRVGDIDDFEEFANIFEELVTKSNIMKYVVRDRNYDSYNNKQMPDDTPGTESKQKDKDKSSNSKPQGPPIGVGRRCYGCGSTDPNHKFCKRDKKIMNVTQEQSSSDEEEVQSESSKEEEWKWDQENEIDNEE